MKKIREAEVERNTKETAIHVLLNLDGEGRADIQTGIGFFDHMLESFARHGFFDLSIQAEGDLQTGDHHTIEDVGIVLGMALKESLGDKEGICRFGSQILAMDDALVLASIDLGGRPWFSFDATFRAEKCGDMSTQMVQEFFYALTMQAGMNLHLKVLDGQNDHHIIEALFKAFARALEEAIRFDDRIIGVLSTKGSL